MALFPEYPIVGVSSDKQIPTKTYKMDWENGRIIGNVNKEEAVQQAIKKSLLTPRYDCLAYDDQYGSELDRLLKSLHNVTREYIEAELPALIEDALTADGRISAVQDISFEFIGDELSIDLTAVTSYGDTRLNVTGVIS